MPILFASMAVLVRIFSNSFANVLQKKLTNQSHYPALLVNFIVYTLLSFTLIPLASVQNWSTYPTSFWYWAILVGLLGASGNGLLVKALEYGELSILGPINAWKPVIGMIGAIFILWELPRIGSLSGIALIIAGSYLVLGAGEGGFHWRILMRRDIQYRFYALILTGLEAAAIKKTVLLANVESAFLIWCWFGAVFSLAGLLLFRISVKQLIELKNGRSWWLLLCLAGLFGAMQYSTNIAFRWLPVGLALALFQLSSIVNLWLGRQYFQERNIRRKLAGTLVMLIGAAIILLT